MSVELCVFLNETDLATREQWQRAIRDAGHNFEFDEFSPSEMVGFLPVRLDGRECGFEYSFDPIDDSEGDEVLSMIGDRTHVVTFRLHGGSTLDLRAAQIAATALTSLAKGVYFDPQSGAHAEGDAVFALLADERDAEQERKLAEAERKWAKVTERRCPECNARCPEYRGSCWVCGFAIGTTPG